MPLTTTSTKAVTQLDDVLALARDLIDADQRELMRGPGAAAVSCRAGCTACCNHLVPVGPAELRSIRSAIAAMQPDARSATEARIRQTAATLRAAGYSHESVRRTPVAERKALWKSYFGAQIMCPLNVDGVCSVRDVRPLACREYLVSSDPDHCATPGEGTIVRIRSKRDVLNNYAKLEANHHEFGWFILALALDAPIPETAPWPAESQASVFRQLTAS